MLSCALRLAIISMLMHAHRFAPKHSNKSQLHKIYSLPTDESKDDAKFDNVRIRVKNLAFTVTEEELRLEMAHHDTVTHVHLPWHHSKRIKKCHPHQNDSSRGWGYAFFTLRRWPRL
jgi:RNA recognition motif-containing protein